MFPDQPAPVETERRTALPAAELAAPLALIARASEAATSLASLVGEQCSVVTFPSLADFCATLEREANWVGVVVSEWSVWDSHLERCIPDRRRFVIHGYAEGYGWPDDVRRTSTPDELRVWLAELPKAKSELRAASSAEDATAPASEAHSSSAVAFNSDGHLEEAEVAAEGTAQTPQDDAVDEAVVVGEVAAETPQKPRHQRAHRAGRASKASSAERQQKLPLPDRIAEERPGGSGGVVPRRQVDAGEAMPREHRAESEAHLDREQDLIALAVQIGLARAFELMRQLRARAHGVLS